MGALTWRRRIELYRALRVLAGRAGYDLIPRNVYSPAPEIPPPDSDVWTRRSPLPGIDLDLDGQLRFLRSELASFVAEASEDLGGPDFELWNGFYQAGDAEVLYALVRSLKPRRVREIGSGHSTLVTAAACARNAREGSPADFVAVDPEPRIGVDVEGVTRLERRRAERLPVEWFDELDAGDVLFVDTSHVVKRGGEVNRLVLDVLPRLRKDVVVHFHDVFWPYEYPRAWYVRGTYSTEQYVLQAFLSGNSGYEVVLSLHALSRDRRQELEELVPSLAGAPAHHPAALWLRRSG
jgi:Methyltransferase domain